MRVIIRLVMASVFLLTLNACEDPEDRTLINNRGFVYCGQGQPNTFNPQLTDGGLTAEVLSNQLFDRLLQLDPDSHKPVSMLAKAWTVSEDGKRYVFKLRQNVHFHTTAWFSPTREMTSEDVVFSFRRLIDPENAYSGISGGQYPWFNSLDFSGLVESVDAVDKYTVAFTLSRPDVSFLATLSTPYAVIHSAEYATLLVKNNQQDRIDHYPVGTGPFYLEQYKPNELIRLKRHWDYWNGAAPMEQVVFDISSRGTGRLAKLITHECDVLSAPIASQLSVIEGDKKFVLSSQTGMNVAFLALNTRHPALSELEVRQAINYAINRSALLKSVYYGTGNAATGMLPPMSWAYDTTAKTPYDPQLAMALMAKGGYRNGFEVNLLVPTLAKPYNPSPRKTAELIQADLKEIGVKVNIVSQEEINRQSLRDDPAGHDMVLTGWIADNGDPDNFLRPLLSCNAKFTGWNMSNWCNRYFDRFLDAAISTSDIAERKTDYFKAQQILRDRLPVIPLAHGVYFQARQADLKGFSLTPYGDNSFANVSRGGR
ncbi:peptide ABC transporter substrate-binding protein SapA [Veronia nyctiphanis]|uniref:Peptide ABC transporter substrate-binding protein SapA n=1 Tax=Veronia nyctiphanis TaxID=1278244 RepID=A0A4Q0YSR4_9GAMM|nr:ABC transporter substrate-binding protein SapA [Veronia nyctiphanis]RXJ73735.1 peptide ABC transporter substrate-binding protein SapA [Veronia nyctiphanis]